MSEEEKYKKCNNCRQDIPESKMFLHEAFCLKNNKFCPECNKVFLSQEFEEHLKTHNEKNKQKKSSPPKIPEKKNKINQEKPSLSEHRKNCKHSKKEPIPKIRPKVDDNLGLKQCEFCVNVVENLSEHLKTCKVKKMIEEENAKYYKDLEKRNREDDILAQKLSKEKIMDISKDEEMAKKMQKDLKPIIDTSKDEQMARNLQKSFQPMVDTSNDEQMARNLQMQFGQANNNTNNDERMARDLQNQYNNQQIGRNRGVHQRRGNNNQYQYDFNPPAPGQNADFDEELKKAIEQSKKEFYK